MQVYSNQAQTYIDSDILAGDTIITVSVTDGGLFTDPGIGEYEILTITDGVFWEVVRLDSRSSDTLNVTRAIEGVARAWPSGTLIKSSITKGTLEEFIQRQQEGAAINIFAYQNYS